MADAKDGDPEEDQSRFVKHTCPSCKAELRVPLQYVGATGKCLRCGNAVTIPRYHDSFLRYLENVRIDVEDAPDNISTVEPSVASTSFAALEGLPDPVHFERGRSAVERRLQDRVDAGDVRTAFSGAWQSAWFIPLRIWIGISVIAGISGYRLIPSGFLVVIIVVPMVIGFVVFCFQKPRVFLSFIACIIGIGLLLEGCLMLLEAGTPPAPASIVVVLILPGVALLLVGIFTYKQG